MKRRLLIVFVMTIAVPWMLSAQFVLKKELNAPRGGDEIIKYQVEYKDPGRSGENVVWDFSRLLPVNNEYTLVYSTPSPVGDTFYIPGPDTLRASAVEEGDLLTGTEHYTMYYYRQQEGRLRVIGHENATNRLRYSTPLLSAVYPLAYLDSCDENYESSGIYSSSQAFSASGSVTITADAKGMMILPSGDTLHQVLRVKTLQTIQGSETAETTGLLENYKWYAYGYRYPVFETVKTATTTAGVETGEFSTAFFYPPQEHYYLEDDEANLALQENGNIKEEPVDPWEGLKYNFYPNPVSSVLNIEFYLPRTARVQLQLHSPTGFQVLSENKGTLSQGVHHLHLNLPALSSGNYLLTILPDDYPLSKVIMKR